jgi:DNA polymerase-3 subunit alpha
MVDDFVDRKHGRKTVEYLVPQLEPILKETYGVVVYQEQVMKIAGDLANYSMAEADDLRKAMGKKIPEILAKHRERFMQGATDNGISPDKAGKIFYLMEKFGGYGFNKSHSAAYSLIAYQTAFLKAHFPVEFMASLLTSEMHSTDGVVKYIAECKSHGIEVLPPDINESGNEFSVTGSKIRFGLVAVKNVGENAIESIVETRNKGGKFSSLCDFCERVDLRKVNKRVVESLIKCGAFDSTGDYRSRMTASIENVFDYGQRVQKERSDPQIGLFDMPGSGPAINLPTMPEIDEWSEKQLLALEKESLGFYITGHPLSGHEDILEKFTNANSVVIKEKKDGATVRIGGTIRNLKTIKTKKKGSLMAFVTLEDLHGSVEATVFSSLYAKVHDLLTDDRPILIQGQLQKDENSEKILADTIIPIDKAEETWTASVHFNLDITRTQRESLVKLKEILKSHPGSCRAYIHLLNPDKTETIVALSDSIKLKAGLSLTREVNRFLGYNAVETGCKPAMSPFKT